MWAGKRVVRPVARPPGAWTSNTAHSSPGAFPRVSFLKRRKSDEGEAGGRHREMHVCSLRAHAGKVGPHTWLFRRSTGANCCC